MPAHSSHHLQPSDVGCFVYFKQPYGKQVTKIVDRGIHYIDEGYFLNLYQEAREAAKSPSNASSGFRAWGLVPLNAQHVLE